MLSLSSKGCKAEDLQDSIDEKAVDLKSITRVTVGGSGITLAEDSKCVLPIGICRSYNSRRRGDGGYDIEWIHAVYFGRWSKLTGKAPGQSRHTTVINYPRIQKGRFWQDGTTEEEKAGFWNVGIHFKVITCINPRGCSAVDR